METLCNTPFLQAHPRYKYGMCRFVVGPFFTHRTCQNILRLAKCFCFELSLSVWRSSLHNGDSTHIFLLGFFCDPTLIRGDSLRVDLPLGECRAGGHPDGQDAQQEGMKKRKLGIKSHDGSRCVGQNRFGHPDSSDHPDPQG